MTFSRNPLFSEQNVDSQFLNFSPKILFFNFNEPAMSRQYSTPFQKTEQMYKWAGWEARADRCPHEDCAHTTSNCGRRAMSEEERPKAVVITFSQSSRGHVQIPH